MQHIVTLSVEVVRQMGWDKDAVDLELFSIGRGRVVLQIARPPWNTTPQGGGAEKSKRLFLSLFGDEHAG